MRGVGPINVERHQPGLGRVVTWQAGTHVSNADMTSYIVIRPGQGFIGGFHIAVCIFQEAVIAERRHQGFLVGGAACLPAIFRGGFSVWRA